MKHSAYKEKGSILTHRSRGQGLMDPTVLGSVSRQLILAGAQQKETTLPSPAGKGQIAPPWRPCPTHTRGGAQEPPCGMGFSVQGDTVLSFCCYISLVSFRHFEWGALSCIHSEVHTMEWKNLCIPVSWLLNSSVSLGYPASQAWHGRSWATTVLKFPKRYCLEFSRQYTLSGPFYEHCHYYIT